MDIRLCCCWLLVVLYDFFPAFCMPNKLIPSPYKCMSSCCCSFRSNFYTTDILRPNRKGNDLGYVTWQLCSTNPIGNLTVDDSEVLLCTWASPRMWLVESLLNHMHYRIRWVKWCFCHQERASVLVRKPVFTWRQREMSWFLLVIITHPTSVCFIDAIAVMWRWFLEGSYEIQDPEWGDLISRETISGFWVSTSFGEFLADSCSGRFFFSSHHDTEVLSYHTATVEYVVLVVYARILIDGRTRIVLLASALRP